MSYRISKTFKIEYAHQLVGHNGKCAHLHGHSGQITVLLEAESLIENGPSQGMVVDYADVKRAMEPILQQLDHHFLAQGNEPVLRVIPPEDVFYVGTRTTAEQLASWVLVHVVHNLTMLNVAHGRQTSVGVIFSETESTTAEVWDDGR